MSSRRHDESGQGEEEIAVMMVAAMLLGRCDRAGSNYGGK